MRGRGPIQSGFQPSQPEGTQPVPQMSQPDPNPIQPMSNRYGLETTQPVVPHQPVEGLGVEPVKKRNPLLEGFR